MWPISFKRMARYVISFILFFYRIYYKIKLIVPKKMIALQGIVKLSLKFPPGGFLGPKSIEHAPLIHRWRSFVSSGTTPVQRKLAVNLILGAPFESFYLLNASNIYFVVSPIIPSKASLSVTFMRQCEIPFSNSEKLLSAVMRRVASRFDLPSLQEQFCVVAFSGSIFLLTTSSAAIRYTWVCKPCSDRNCCEVRSE